MKAADLEIGGEYMAQSGEHRAKRRVVILEAPTVGWHNNWRFGYYSREHGRIDTSPTAKRDHAHVRVMKRDRTKEREIRFETFNDLADERKAQEGWEDLPEHDRERILKEIMDSIKIDPIWVLGGTDRILLRNIKMPWEQHEELEAKATAAKQERKDDALAKKTRAGILNERLEALGLELHLEYLGGRSVWRLRAVAATATTDRTLDRDWHLLRAIENLLDEVGA